MHTPLHNSGAGLASAEDVGTASGSHHVCDPVFQQLHSGLFTQSQQVAGAAAMYPLNSEPVPGGLKHNIC